jgi:CDP-glucose 4,6-dehydratase
MAIDPLLWNGKRILVTGHTGFKGAWLTVLLKRFGADVIGYSLPPSQPKSLYQDAHTHTLLKSEYLDDIRDYNQLKKVIDQENVQYVFHLAAQALVGRSVRDPIESISTNVLGTTNVLMGSLSSEGVEGITLVTTDKVYENYGDGIPFREYDKLGGTDPYSASKASADILGNALAISNNPRSIPVATVRAGNVIGGGDWGQDRLVPDIIRALTSSSPIILRNKDATRPWQHVLDCIYGYMLLGQAHLDKTISSPISMNFGPTDSMSVIELIALFEKTFNQEIVQIRSEDAFTEHKKLVLDSRLAYSVLKWRTSMTTLEAVTMTANWYSQQIKGQDARLLMEEDISKFLGSR